MTACELNDNGNKVHSSPYSFGRSFSVVEVNQFSIILLAFAILIPTDMHEWHHEWSHPNYYRKNSIRINNMVINATLLLVDHFEPTVKQTITEFLLQIKKFNNVHPTPDNTKLINHNKN